MRKNHFRCLNPTLIPVILLLGLAISACTANSSFLETVETSETPAPPFTTGADFSEQEAGWRQRLAADPTNPEANYYLGLILAITNPGEAPDFLSTAAAADPALAANIDRVNDALRIGELSENQAYRLTLLGQAFGALQEWELALSALELATQADPTYAEAWAYLGEAQQQNDQDGLQALETALTINPDSYSANLLMALYLRRNDSPAEALDRLLVAAAQDPNNLSLKEDIAHTYADAGDVETGLSVLVEAADASPEQSVVWQMLARMSLNYDIKLDEIGFPAARQAVLLDEEDPVGLLLLGRCYLQTGDTAMAERFLWQAAQLAPDYAEAHYFLGILYLNRGDQAAAREQLRLAYRLAPDGAIGLQALQVLEQYFGSSHSN